MKTAKDWFEEELSGEPLTEESVIEVLEMIQKETWNEALDKAAESARLGNTENGVNGVYNVLEVSKNSILKLKV